MPSAYIIANVQVTNPQQYEDYKRLSTIAMQTYGAEVCVRGGKVEVLEGDWSPERLVVLKFPDAAAARRFNRLAWPAFAVLVATGLWNLAEVHVGDQSDEYLVTLFLKLAAVGLSGGGAAVHIVGRSKAALAIGGALSSIGAIAALFLGVVLHS